MRRYHFARSIPFAIALVLTSLSLPQHGSAENRSAAGISVDVTVKPVDAARTQFMCTARIVDLASGSVLMAPRVQVLAGREGIAKSSPQEGVDVLFTVRVGDAGTEASYSVEHSRDGVMIAKQSGSIALDPPGPRPVR